MCGSTTGKTPVVITDFNSYNEFYIQLYFQGYVTNWIIPRMAFAAGERTLSVTRATTSNIPYYGGIKYSTSNVYLYALYDYQNNDISATAQIDILGKV